MIFIAFAKAVGQLPDPRFQSVLWRGIGLAIALLVALYMVLRQLVTWLASGLASGPVTLPGGFQITWLDDALGWGTLGLVLFASVFLMVPVASLITSFYLDEVAEAVEDSHYADQPRPPPVNFWDGVADTIRFFGVLVTANIAAFVLYVLLPFAAVFIFYALNGYLLGREYFQLVAMRREGRAAAQAMRKEHSGTIWLAGCLMAVPLSFPLVNLIIPILGAATFTHLYHRLRAG